MSVNELGAQLLGISEIAEVGCVTRACVSQWRKKYRDFPKPIVELRCGPVFMRPEVIAWMQVHVTREFGNDKQREMAQWLADRLL
jgi:hypothetical protein